jgi:GNAT superfamily N-acetyltransferase
MSKDQFMLSYEVINKSDIPELTRVMTRAFDDDTKKHLAQERGGPEGYDNGDFFHKWLFGYKETNGYKVLCQGHVIGGIIVWILPERHNILGTVFIDSDFQDQGVGTQAWQFIESRYPDTKSWRLSTPKWATKNHYFYETKCGFQRVEKDSILGAPEGQFIYWKEIHSDK